MKKTVKRIGEILIEKGWITEAQLHDALTEQRLGDKFLGTILKDKGWISDKELADIYHKNGTNKSIEFRLPSGSRKTCIIPFF